MIKEVKNIVFSYMGDLVLDEETKERSMQNWEILKKESSLLQESNILIVDDLNSIDKDYYITLKSCKFSYAMYCKKHTDTDIHCIFSGAYIRTDEDDVMYVLSKYYDEKEFANVNLVGGMADESDVINNEYSSINNLKREFKEELGFELDDEFIINLKYIKIPSERENTFRYVIGMIYEVRTSLTKEQIQDKFQKCKNDGEITSLIFFNRNNFHNIYNYEHKVEYLPELLEKTFI